MNYGETLAYWYLRLNGFFPLTNYVLHKVSDRTVTGSADCDILAVRLPKTFELIGGQEADWDENLSLLGVTPTPLTNGLIVEVKTGRYSVDDLRADSFSRQRIEYAIQRLGFWSSTTVGQISEILNTQSYYFDDNFKVTKLLIADRVHRQPLDAHWKTLELKDVDKFIEARFRRYGQKFSDRHFFPSDLMQYMIWKNQSS